MTLCSPYYYIYERIDYCGMRYRLLVSLVYSLEFQIEATFTFYRIYSVLSQNIVSSIIACIQLQGSSSIDKPINWK